MVRGGKSGPVVCSYDKAAHKHNLFFFDNFTIHSFEFKNTAQCTTTPI